MQGCLWGMWHTFDEKTKAKLLKFLKSLEEKDKQYSVEGEQDKSSVDNEQ